MNKEQEKYLRELITLNEEHNGYRTVVDCAIDLACTEDLELKKEMVEFAENTYKNDYPT